MDRYQRLLLKDLSTNFKTAALVTLLLTPVLALYNYVLAFVLLHLTLTLFLTFLDYAGFAAYDLPGMYPRPKPNAQVANQSSISRVPNAAVGDRSISRSKV